MSSVRTIDSGPQGDVLPGALDPACSQPGAVQDGFDMGEAFQVRRIEFLGEQAGGTAAAGWVGWLLSWAQVVQGNYL